VFKIKLQLEMEMSLLSIRNLPSDLKYPIVVRIVVPQPNEKGKWEVEERFEAPEE
jgi:hypothetical protein